ncbi:MAG: hypothetical protein H7315_10505 [Herminiimonas sp.]|nr:hypothetical protein [Herminiimonas sp.]
MNYRNLSPALAAVLLTIVSIGSVAVFDSESRATGPLQAQSAGFDALAQQVFGGVTTLPVLTSATTVTSDEVASK